MAIIRTIIRILIWLRYSITIKGIDDVLAKGNRGILFAANHPALIDPVILNSYLNKRFNPRPIADEKQIDRPLIRYLARAVRAVSIPDMVISGAKGGVAVTNALRVAAKALKQGENILLYPAGHLSQSMFDDLGANSALDSILKFVPDVRIVIVRTRGLWGSSFGHGCGERLSLDRAIYKAGKSLFLNAVFFGPRRKVTIEFIEPDNFPRSSGCKAINRYIETFYNKDAPPAIYIPYTIWERNGKRTIPEPEPAHLKGDVNTVPPATRKIVIDHLGEITGIGEIKDNFRLAHDMGLDSLARAELIVWISREFGFPQGDTDSMQTVADCLLAACGRVISSDKSDLKPVPGKWFKNGGDSLPVTIPDGDTLTDVFLQQFRNNPGRIVIADQNTGARTYREIVAGIITLKSVIKKIPGKYIGIMLPASAVTDIVYLAVLFSGKTPVMINWTLGNRSLSHCLNLTEVKKIITAKSLMNILESQGSSLNVIHDKLLFLEEIVSTVSKRQKILAFAGSYFGGRILQNIKVSEDAVILFTSGSESLPKAVPLTHRNLLANIRDIVLSLSLNKNDSLIGMLPPFHSFGLTGSMLLPLCAAVKIVYHSNPTEALTLARLIEAYKISVLIGTPSFLQGIARAAKPQQMASLTLAFSGAEKCPESVYEALYRVSPHLKILEGYGITECSPVVSVNRPENAKPYTIGEAMNSLDYVVVDPGMEKRVEKDTPGMLLLRGPSIFNGYLNHNGESPFVDFEGKLWYKTGDLITEDQDGVFTFYGRLKRFIKLGGEMISLPAIESVLYRHYRKDDGKGPEFAVEACHEGEYPEIVLFTTSNLARETINRQIRDGGLSPLHNIRRTVKLDSIPVLGTGKIDYRFLKESLNGKKVL